MSAPPILVGDATPGTPTVAVRVDALPCLVVDHLWEYFAEQGSRALDDGEPRSALASWSVAAALADGFTDSDPRRAASLAGLAIAGLAAGRLTPIAAERELRAAAEAWRTTDDWIERMALELSGRSSMFHFRLERRHQGAYRDLKRAECRRLGEAGAALCLAHLASTVQARNPDQAAELYRGAIAARRAGLGARDLACFMVMQNLHHLIGDEAAAPPTMKDPIAPLDRWKSERGAKMNDHRRLLASVYLAPLPHRR